MTGVSTEDGTCDRIRAHTEVTLLPGGPTRRPCRRPRRTFPTALLLALALPLVVPGLPARAADHNDPNAVNSIFSDVPISPADLYDFFGFPGDGTGDCLFQTVNMPDDSWRRSSVAVRLNQVATRFLSLFLDMATGCGGAPCHVDSLADQALWDAAPVEPKTPPNPLANDKEFLDRFPYLAEPW